MATGTEASAAYSRRRADTPPSGIMRRADDRVAFEHRYEAEQLRRIAQQFGRLPLVFVAINAFIAWLGIQADLLAFAAGWFAIATAFDLWRYRLCIGEQAAPSPVPRARLATLSYAFVAAGLLRVAMLLAVFSVDALQLHVMYTMVCVGLAAGGIATVGAMFWAYAAWAALVGGSLVLAWWWRGDAIGWGTGALIAMLFMTLTNYARDHGASLRTTLELAHANEVLAASLRIERDRAELASESKTRFFAAASHDLRQPLHALSINATTLELVARRQADPLIRELAASIMRALRQSNDLLDTLLDISQLDARIVDTALDAVDAVEILTQLRDAYTPMATQRGLALELDAPSAAVWVHTDAKQLRRLLGNLIDNALKFTQQGEVRLELDPARRSGRDGTVALAIVDTGPGIAAGEQQRIFEDFYQIGNRTRDRTRGLGLGLSIVRRTADLLDVDIRLTSAPGHGSRFDVWVPTASPPNAIAPAAPTTPDTGQSPDLRDLRVLAIDDELDILQSLSHLLPHYGCELRCAQDLGGALAVVDAGFVPQLLLVDHRLEGATGLQTIQQLRARLGAVPAVIVTGDTAPHDLRTTRASGTRVVHKPIDGQLLAGAMAEAIAQPAG